MRTRVRGQGILFRVEKLRGSENSGVRLITFKATFVKSKINAKKYMVKKILKLYAWGEGLSRLGLGEDHWDGHQMQEHLPAPILVHCSLYGWESLRNGEVIPPGVSQDYGRTQSLVHSLVLRLWGPQRLYSLPSNSHGWCNGGELCPARRYFQFQILGSRNVNFSWK